MDFSETYNEERKTIIVGLRVPTKYKGANEIFFRCLVKIVM